MGLIQLSKENPSDFNLRAIEETALQTMGWSNPGQYMVPEGTPPQPTPDEMAKIADVQNKGKEADARVLDAQTNAQKVKQEGLAAANDTQGGAQQDTPVDILEAQTRAREVNEKMRETEMESDTADKDRASDEKIAAVDLAKEIVNRAADIRQAEAAIPKVEGETAKSVKKPKSGPK
jgi:hypothetical protein